MTLLLLFPKFGWPHDHLLLHLPHPVHLVPLGLSNTPSFVTKKFVVIIIITLFLPRYDINTINQPYSASLDPKMITEKKGVTNRNLK